MPSLKNDGWCLLSGEDQHLAAPDSFWIPARSDREGLRPGDAAQLLFDVETREAGRVIDRGVDRMWVIVKSHTPTGYIGLLDSDPGLAESLKLRPGDEVAFGPEHVVNIDTPPPEYVSRKYGLPFAKDAG